MELTILHSHYHLRYNFLQEVHREEMIAYVSSSKYKLIIVEWVFHRLKFFWYLAVLSNLIKNTYLILQTLP